MCSFEIEHRRLGLAAKRVRCTKISAREREIRIQVYGPLQPADGVVVPTREKFKYPQGGMREGV